MAPSDDHAHLLTPIPPPVEACGRPDPTKSSETLLLDVPPRPQPLAPLRPYPASGQEQPGGQRLWMFLLAVLAFLLASSAARNSDVWMHLARGRWLVHGQFALGLTDPIAPGVPANPSWLYDLIGYVLYSTLGETALVLSKAFVVVALALVMFRLTRTGGEAWLGAFCTALALLATGERLLLQPVAVSYLFLALTVFFVVFKSASSERDSPLPPLPLFLLFVIWANVDRWFVLGLLLAALVWLGQVLDRAFGRAAGGEHWGKLLGARAIALVILAAGCLVNPFFVRVFALPAELASSSLLGFASDGQIFDSVSSPFERAYLAGRALTPAGMAYYVLLALSLISFALNARYWSWQRFLPWLGLTLLSIAQVRTVPFFAIVAGPILAWNTRDFLARRLQADSSRKPTWRRVALAAHVLTALLLVLMPVLAWPGWLQSPPFEPRKWTIETPAALMHGAATMAAWGEGQKPRDAQSRTLHLSPESIYTFAWFCPDLKGVRDPELTAALQRNRATDPDTLARLRAAAIDRIVVYDANRPRFLATMDTLFSAPRQWTLRHMEGYLAIFDWHDPARSSSESMRDDNEILNHLAFHPLPSQRAPGKAVEREPEERLWWEAFWKPVPPRLVEQEEATLHLKRADVLARSAPQHHQLLWDNVQFSSLLASAAGWSDWTALIDARLHLALVKPLTPGPDREYASLPVIDRLAHAWKMRFFHAQDDTSPASLFLAIRAGRRALALNPEAAQAYLVLGESYLRLLHNTRERQWSERWMELVQLRRCQACTALNQAVVLKPDFAAAHLNLYILYREMGFLDLAYKHLRTYADLVQKNGPLPGESVERFLERMASMRQEVSRVAKEIENREYSFLAASAGWKVGDRAAKASQEGLAGKALELLLESDVSAFGKQGMSLELELLLKTGQARKIVEWTGPEQQSALRGVYHLLRIQAQAALGNYDQAREECAEMSDAMTRMPGGQNTMGVREIMAGIIGQNFLSESRIPNNLGDLILRSGQQQTFIERLQEFSFSLRKEADMIVLRGLLALEQGDSEEAEVAFRQALSLWKNADAAARNEGLDFEARIVAQEYLTWLERSRTGEAERR
jgi:tetratricopeptide (TPR) repeat protein